MSRWPINSTEALFRTISLTVYERVDGALVPCISGAGTESIVAPIRPGGCSVQHYKRPKAAARRQHLSKFSPKLHTSRFRKNIRQPLLRTALEKKQPTTTRWLGFCGFEIRCIYRVGFFALRLFPCATPPAQRAKPKVSKPWFRPQEASSSRLWWF